MLHRFDVPFDGLEGVTDDAALQVAVFLPALCTFAKKRARLPRALFKLYEGPLA